MKKKKEKDNAAFVLRKGRLAVAMIGIVLCMVITDSLRRDFFKDSTKATITVDGVFRSKTADEPQGIVAFDPNVQAFTTPAKAPERGYNNRMVPAEALSQGMLVIPTEASPAVPESSRRMVNLSDYMNDCYNVLDEDMVLAKEAADALNNMMKDYNEATGLNDFVVCGTTDTYTGDGSVCPKKYADCDTGYTVDLGLYGYLGLIGYDGYDEEGWIIQNCHKYGFIVRYPSGKEKSTGESFCPWHLRYVGKPHSEAMHEYNMCLEEYLNYIIVNSVDEPVEYSVEYAHYKMYAVPSEGDTTAVKVPLSGSYEISGDGSGYFIITAKGK